MSVRSHCSFMMVLSVELTNMLWWVNLNFHEQMFCLNHFDLIWFEVAVNFAQRSFYNGSDQQLTCNSILLSFSFHLWFADLFHSRSWLRSDWGYLGKSIWSCQSENAIKQSSPSEISNYGSGKRQYNFTDAYSLYLLISYVCVCGYFSLILTNVIFRLWKKSLQQKAFSTETDYWPKQLLQQWVEMAPSTWFTLDFTTQSRMSYHR